MDSSTADRNPFDRLAEEFAVRVRRGERPPLSEYTDKYPELADDIRRAFPAIVMMERLKPVAGDSSGLDLGRTPHPRRTIPERLGDYRILRFIAEGGMGYVFEAEQESMGRHVALKVLKPEILNTKHLARFLRESKAPGRLHHTNIIPIFGIGECDGLHFYAMQFIHGESLQRVIADLRRIRDAGRKQSESLADEDGPHSATLASISQSLQAGTFGEPGSIAAFCSTDVDVDGLEHSPCPVAPAVLPGKAEPGIENGTDSGLSASRSGLEQPSGRTFYKSVARIGEQAARALASAHRNGVLHRDIKPANLLLDLQGTVWVADFGLAYQADAEDLSRGDVVGTLRFIPPERFQRQSLPQGDIYSLGLTLYELLTLEPAFRSSDSPQLMHLIEHGHPRPPRAIDREVPRDLETIILKAIDKEPARRYATADELADDLVAFREDREIRGRRAGLYERFERWCRRSPAVARLSAFSLLLLLTIALAGSIMSVKLREALDKSESARADLGRQVLEEKESRFRAHRSEARARRYSRRLGQRFTSLDALGAAVGLARELRKPTAVFDELRNEAIASLAVADLRPLASWTYRPPGAGEHPDGLWHSLDQALQVSAYYAEDRGMISVRRVRDGTEQHRLAGLTGDGAELRLSLDGRFLANWDHSRLNVWRLTDRPARLIAQDAGELEFGGFSPDSRLMAVRRRNAALHIHDLETGQLALKLDLGFQAGCAFHPSAPQLAVGSRLTIQIRDIRSGHLDFQWPHQGAAESIAWNPDGALLASASREGVTVWRAANGEKVHQLPHPGGGLWVAFDPSGEVIYTGSQSAGTMRLWHARTGKLLLSDSQFGFPDLFPTTGLLLDSSRRELLEVATAPEYRTLVSGLQAAKDFHMPAIDPTGRLLAVGRSSGLSVWAIASGAELGFLPLGQLRKPLFERSGSLLTYDDTGAFRWPVRLESAGTVRVGPPETLAIAPFMPHELWIDASRDGQVVALANNDGAFVLRRDRPGRPLWLRQDACRYVAVSPDGHWVATGTHDGGRDRNIWDARSGALVHTLDDSTGGQVSFSPDGRWLATETNLWAVDGWELGPEIGHGFHAHSDNSALLVSGSGGTVVLMEARTGRELARLEDPNQDDGSNKTLSPDGTRLVTTNNGGSIHIWDLRLIRRQLAELDLDWDAPPYPPEPPHAGDHPLRLVADYGSIRPILDDPQQTLARCSAEVRRQPANPEALYQRGFAQARLGQSEEALADLRTAAALAPTDQRTHLLMGEIQLYLERHREALASLTRAIRLPTPPDRSPNALDGRLIRNLVRRCVVTTERLVPPEEVLPLALKLVEVLPTPTHRSFLGITYYRLGRHAEAIACFERDLTEQQERLLPYDLYFLAMSYQKTGEPAKARECLERALRLHEKTIFNVEQTAELNAARAEAEGTLKK